MNTPQFVDEVYDFCIENGDGLFDNRDLAKFKEYLAEHVKYRTLMCLKDDKGFTAICRWNFIDDTTIHVVDVVMRRDIRILVALKELLYKGLMTHPHKKPLTHFVFERESKYPNREPKKYSFHEFLKRRS